MPSFTECVPILATQFLYLPLLVSISWLKHFLQSCLDCSSIFTVKFVITTLIHQSHSRLDPPDTPYLYYNHLKQATHAITYFLLYVFNSFEWLYRDLLFIAKIPILQYNRKEACLLNPQSEKFWVQSWGKRNRKSHVSFSMITESVLQLKVESYDNLSHLCHETFTCHFALHFLFICKQCCRSHLIQSEAEWGRKEGKTAERR